MSVTDRQIRQAYNNGATTLNALQSELGVATNCGTCSQHAQQLLHDLAQQTRSPLASLPAVVAPAPA